MTRRPGRPTLLTPEVQEQILAALAVGAAQAHAAECAGIGESTFYRWMERGEEEDAPEEFREFREAVTRTRARAAVDAVQLIQRIAVGGQVTKETTRTYRDPDTGERVEETEVVRAPPDWRAAAWWLERAHPAQFSRPRVEVTGPDGGPVQVQEETLAALAGRVRANAIEAGLATGELPAADGREDQG